MSDITIGKMLKGARGTATQEAFGARFGWDKHKYCNVENDKKLPTFNDLDTIAAIIDVKYDFIKTLWRTAKAVKKALRKSGRTGANIEAA